MNKLTSTTQIILTLTGEQKEKLAEIKRGGGRILMNLPQELGKHVGYVARLNELPHQENTNQVELKLFPNHSLLKFGRLGLSSLTRHHHCRVGLHLDMRCWHSSHQNRVAASTSSIHDMRRPKFSL
jgi:hypothetical protein